jgi:hypothetical protein
MRAMLNGDFREAHAQTVNLKLPLVFFYLKFLSF